MNNILNDDLLALSIASLFLMKVRHEMKEIWLSMLHGCIDIISTISHVLRVGISATPDMCRITRQPEIVKIG